MTIGENLRTIRKERGLDQVELASLAGVAQPSISLLETGRRGAQTRTLQKLADALNVPVAAFFAEDSEAPPKIPPPPKTRLASSTPEEIETRLFGAPAAQAELEGELRPVLSEPQVRELSDTARRERDALELWIAAYTTASEAERFARRADYERAQELRGRIRFVHDWVFDAWSKLYDPRPVPFKSARQFAAQTVEARQQFLSALQNDAESRRVEQSGQAG
jgi:transcriptional regulator with XRE-family HTH domain